MLRRVHPTVAVGPGWLPAVYARPLHLHCCAIFFAVVQANRTFYRMEPKVMPSQFTSQSESDTRDHGNSKCSCFTSALEAGCVVTVRLQPGAPCPVTLNVGGSWSSKTSLPPSCSTELSAARRTHLSTATRHKVRQYFCLTGSFFGFCAVFS